MRFVFAAGLAEVVAARDGSRLCEGDLRRQASIRPDLRLLNLRGPWETSENPSGFHGMAMVRQRLVRGSGKSRSSYGW
jgi:hypothetical protein